MSFLRQAILLYNDILSSLALLWLIIKLSECDILMGLTLSSRCQVLYARKIGTLKAYKDPVFIGWHSRYAIFMNKKIRFIL